MAYYLVDYENVKADGMYGVDQLGKKDCVCIFYSENASTLTFGLHEKLNQTKGKIVLQKVEVGVKNALDFQLSTYLGYLISENEGKNETYYIVSEDKGLAILTGYWAERGENVKTASDIAAAKEDLEEEKSSKTEKKEKKEKPEKKKIVEMLATEKGLVPFYINVNTEDENIPLEKRVKISIEQWLRSFSDASLVVTDSFHGCVFSVIFKRQFIAIGNEERGLSRFYSLLNLCSLNNRLIFSSKDYGTYRSLLSEPINYDKVYEKLRIERKRSVDFIKEALKNSAALPPITPTITPAWKRCRGFLLPS